MPQVEAPKYHETFLPILETLKDGKPIQRKDLQTSIVEKYYSNLPSEILNKKIATGSNLLASRIHWGVTYLKIGKFVIYSSRAFVQITAKGKEVLKAGSFSFADLRKDPDYRAHQEEKKNKKDSEIETEPVDADASPQDLIDKGYNQLETQVKSELLEKLKTIDPYSFETVILELLKKMGYGDFIVTPKSNDGGIDGIINEDKLGLEKIYIQAKRFSENKVREKEIRDFIGAMSGDTEKGIFVTTSSFIDEAKNKARDARHKIILIDGLRLVDLMYEYGLGVQVKKELFIKQIDEDFFDNY